MKQSYSMPSLITVISLLLGVIWLGPAVALGAPAFESLGQITAEGLQVPGAMDLDEAGNLYVADERGGKVHKFSPYGALVQSYDLQASGSGFAVTPNGSRWYVSMGQSVAIVDAETVEVLGFLTGAEASGAEFGVAGRIDLDAAGNVFVVDAGAMQIKAYDASGNYLTRFGGAGSGLGQFLKIGGMAVNPAGQVVVSDSSFSNGKVQVYTLNADLSVSTVVSYLKSSASNFGAPIMHDPRGLTFDAQGRGYFLEFQKSQVRVVGESFNYLGSFVGPGYEAGQLNNVKDVVFDRVNSRLFVGCDPARIEILAVDGGSNPVAVNHAPSDPVAQGPSAGSTVTSLMPTLVVGNAEDQDGDTLSYRVVISGSDGFAYQMDVPAAAGETTMVVVDRALTENMSYSWTVQATDGELFSAVSGPANFVVSTVDEAPAQPQLAASFDGAAIDGSGVFSWLESSDPDPGNGLVDYRLEVALDEAFSAESLVAVEALPGLSLSLDALADYADLVDGASYFWRVTAMDAADNESVPSVVDGFVYDTTGLTVTANMPGAKVSFHGNHAYAGQFIGVAPLELRDFTPGVLSVVVERAGFEPYVTQVTLAEGSNAEVYAQLVPSLAVEKLSVSKKGINGRSGIKLSGDAVPFLVDFDNDGDLDMLTANDAGSIELFANMQVVSRNRLSFDPAVSLAPTGTVPFVADWNNDGRKDLIVGQSDGTVKLFINNALEEAPAFAAGVDLLAFPVGLDAAPAVIDFNGDGAKDLLVGNSAGQVLLFVNQGDDATPLFNDFGQEELKLNGGVVPMVIDWDADGVKELLVTNAGKVTVYKKVADQYLVQAQFDDRRADFFAAFPCDLDGSGKSMIAGQTDGTLAYLVGPKADLAASFVLALQDKLDELGGLVAEVDPLLLGDVNELSALISAEDYSAAALSARALADRLPEGSAQWSALEIAALFE